MANEELPAINFGGGVSNRAHETKTPNGFARGASNVDISRDGTVSQREGFGLFAMLSGAHSLWGDPELPFTLVGGASTLNKLDTNASLTPLVSSLSGSDIHYCMTPIGAYWSDGAQSGCVRADGSSGHWGVNIPFALTVNAVAGALNPGDYAVSATFVDATGQEGGAPSSTFITLSSAGAISVATPSSATAVEARVYVTTTNGKELQYAASCVPGSTVVIGPGPRGRPLRTQYMRPLPPLRFPALTKGRLVGAVGRYLMWSQPQYYGLYHPTHDYTAVRGQTITMVAPSDAPGFLIYVGTDQRTYKLEGDSLENAALSVVSHVGVIPGSMARVAPDAVGIEGLSNWVPVWVDNRGVPYAGTNNGVVQLHDKFAYPQFAQAAAVFDQRDGNSRYIVSGRGGAPSPLAFSDYVTATVINAGGGV